MTNEERLHMITEQLLIVRDNLFRGMSKSIQKLQARSINEVLELPNYTQSPPRQWVGLTEQDIKDCEKQAMVNGSLPFEQRSFFARAIEAKLKERNE